MIGTVLIAIVIVAAGTRATDAVRLRQQEIILAKLPTGDAVAYFRILWRRAWTVRILRTIAVVSLVIILYARNRGWQRDHIRSRVSAAEQVTPRSSSNVHYRAQRRYTSWPAGPNANGSQPGGDASTIALPASGRDFASIVMRAGWVNMTSHC